MTIAELFSRIRAALDSAGVVYMLSGSFASAFYGLPRTTQDIDFVIAASPEQLRAFVQGLPSRSYYVDLDAALEAYSRQSLFNVIDSATGWKIDFIIRKSRPFSEEEFRRRQLVDFEGMQLFVASPEDMVIAKLEWSKLARSQRQVEDAAGILRLRRDSLDHSYLRKWISELGLEEELQNAQVMAGISNLS
jgi:hypothetical protein